MWYSSVCLLVAAFPPSTLSGAMAVELEAQTRPKANVLVRRPGTTRTPNSRDADGEQTGGGHQRITASSSTSWTWAHTRSDAISSRPCVHGAGDPQPGSADSVTPGSRESDGAAAPDDGDSMTEEASDAAQASRANTASLRSRREL